MNERVLGVASYTLVTSAAVAAASYIAWRCNVDGSTIAAWVQAIGSIGAIVGGFVLLNRQHELHEQVQARSERQRYAARFEQVFLLTGDAAESLDSLSEMLKPEAFDALAGDNVRQAKPSAKVLLLAARLESIGVAIAELIRSGAVELDHVNLLWKLHRHLNKVGQMMAGVTEPYEENFLTSMRR